MPTNRLRRPDEVGRRSYLKSMSRRKFFRNQSGVATLEYVLIISVAAVIVLALVTGFGQSIIDLFTSASSAI